MAVLTRAESAAVLVDHWDDLPLSRKLLRIRSLRGVSVAGRLVPSEDILHRADVLAENGSLPEEARVSLGRRGEVILGWRTAAYEVGVVLNLDGSSTVEVEVSGHPLRSYEYPPGEHGDAEAARHALNELAAFPRVAQL